jgi:dihydrodipicolinate synthase/N-acetylneuraminate lyase
LSGNNKEQKEMTDRSSFRGLVVPMVSPFTPQGRIDEPAVDRIVEHLIRGGSHGIFALGTTGEAASIHPDDRHVLVARTVRAVNGRALVYAGIASTRFRESLESAADYAALGVDAFVAHVPADYTLSNDQIETYFSRLADQISRPLVLYNIPSTTHQSIPVDAVDRLRRHPNILALKDSSGDPARIAELLRITGGRDGFPILLGNSSHFADGLKHGGLGLVPSGAHLEPQLYRSMFDAAIANRLTEVEQLQHQSDILAARFLKGRTLGQGLAALKALLEERGLCGRTMLPPLTDHSGPV